MDGSRGTTVVRPRAGIRGRCPPRVCACNTDHSPDSRGCALARREADGSDLAKYGRRGPREQPRIHTEFVALSGPVFGPGRRAGRPQGAPRWAVPACAVPVTADRGEQSPPGRTGLRHRRPVRHVGRFCAFGGQLRGGGRGGRHSSRAWNVGEWSGPQCGCAHVGRSWGMSGRAGRSWGMSGGAGRSWGVSGGAGRSWGMSRGAGRRALRTTDGERVNGGVDDAT